MAMDRKRWLATAGAAALGLALIGSLALLVRAQAGRDSLLSRYFRAVADSDRAALEAVTAEGFSSDLPELRLGNGDYELYDFSEGDDSGTDGSGAAIRRFLIVADGRDGKRLAVLAELLSVKRGLVSEILAIRTVDQGRRQRN